MSTFDRRYELMSRAELEQMQLERLQALLARLRRNVRRYREKLADLQQWYAEAECRPNENAKVKELTLRSLKRLIKQLQEEIIWYECHAHIREPIGSAAATTSNTGGPSAPCTN